MLSVNTLYLSFGLLIGHLYPGKSDQKLWFLDYYLSLRLLKLPSHMPLKEAFEKMPEPDRLRLARLLLFTPLPKLGIFGGAPDSTLLKDLKAENEKLAALKTKGPLSANMRKILRAFAKGKAYLEPLYPYSRSMGKKELLKKAAEVIAQNDYCLLSVNDVGLGLITQELFQLAEKTIPKARFVNPDAHAHLLRNAFLAAEIEVPEDLVVDLRKSYFDEFRNFVPIQVFYQLLSQATGGPTFALSCQSFGFLFGFRGSKANRYSVVKEFSGKVNTALSATYGLHYERVLEPVFTGSSPREILTIDPKTKEVGVIDRDKLAPRDDPFRDAEFNGEVVVGRSRGTYIVDHNSFDYETQASQDEMLLNFPHNVRFLSPEYKNDLSLRNSAFTQHHHQARAFETLTDINPVTKPDLSKREAVEDKRWLPIFDEYLASGFSVLSLAFVLLKDEAWYQKNKKRLLSLDRFLKKKGLAHHELEKLPGLHSGIHLDFNQDLEAPVFLSDDEDKSCRALYEHCLNWWVSNFNAPIFAKKIEIKLRQIETGSGKKRLVCREPVLQALFDSFSNRVLQVMYQKANRLISYAVSNFLPGMSVAGYAMDRLRTGLNKRDFALLNMDVKSCFESVSLSHPNFLSCLEDGLKELELLVGIEAASFARQVLKDYLYANMVEHKNFKFTAAEGVDLPKPGTLPTGFVLSPMLWLVLSLPAVMQTAKREQEGKLFAFDLCGDDLIALAPRGLSEEVKKEICQPWFDLAEKLDLKFHFFKNYKDGRVNLCGNQDWRPLFENKVEQRYESAWIDKFPAYSLPVFHAGVALARKAFVLTATTVTEENTLSRFYMQFWRQKKHGRANFSSNHLAAKAKEQLSSLGRSEQGICPARLPTVRGGEDGRLEQNGALARSALTGSVSWVGGYFFHQDRQDALGDMPQVVLKAPGKRFLQRPLSLCAEVEAEVRLEASLPQRWIEARNVVAEEHPAPQGARIVHYQMTTIMPLRNGEAIVDRETRITEEELRSWQTNTHNDQDHPGYRRGGNPLSIMGGQREVSVLGEQLRA